MVEIVEKFLYILITYRFDYFFQIYFIGEVFSALNDGAKVIAEYSSE